MRYAATLFDYCHTYAMRVCLHTLRCALLFAFHFDAGSALD